MDDRANNQIISFIWGIADDCLRDVYVRGKYRDVILPMTVIRRFDAMLEDTKPEVLRVKGRLDAEGVQGIAREQALCSASGQCFYNESFQLKQLAEEGYKGDLKADFYLFLNGFSSNVREILEKFKFHNQVETMAEAGILKAVIRKFTSPLINLSPHAILDEKGKTHPGLDNHAMGQVFEELIRRFSEENNEEAGEHFTPRDVIELMAELAFAPVKDQISDGIYSCYDGACGTGGMLTVAEKRLLKLAEDLGKSVSISLHGQEINPETYAIAKADLMLKGNGEQAENIRFGSTISEDRFGGQSFDFILSNPPFGKTWKTDIEKMTASGAQDKKKKGKQKIDDARFVIDDEVLGFYEMLPRVNDAQLLFLLNDASKMKETKMGSRVVEVHNGSSLFTGDAGQGESEARRFLIESDLVEAVIALPEKMFYNTGIGTFLWILSNRKEKRRKGKIQLIDASGIKEPRLKNLGEKGFIIDEEKRAEILKIYTEFKECRQCRIFDSAEFGYAKITVQRPLREIVHVNRETIEKTKALMRSLGVYTEQKGIPEHKIFEYIANNPSTRAVTIAKSGATLEAEQSLQAFIAVLEQFIREEPYLDKAQFIEAFDRHALHVGRASRFAAVERTGLCCHIVQKDARGSVQYDRNGKIIPDKDLTDYEKVPLTYSGGIEAFMEQEVLPFYPDAFIEREQTKIGYEISFTRYFYQPKELRPLQEILREIESLEAEGAQLFSEIVKGDG